MKISIITVCKNTEDTISKTIDSIIGQAYDNFEIIIIDGGSTDKTLEVLSQYKDKISLTSEPDTGIYNAMNKGIKKATGDVVLFLNANDYLYNKDVFEVVSQIFKSNSDLMFLWGNINFLSENKETLQEEKYDAIRKQIDIAHHNICHQAIFYKKELFDKYGYYDESYKILADWDFNVKTLVKKNVKCAYIDKILTVFQLGGLSTARNKKIKKLNEDERKILIKKNFPELYLLLNIDRFLSKIFKSIYKPFQKRYLKTNSPELNFSNINLIDSKEYSKSNE